MMVMMIATTPSLNASRRPFFMIFRGQNVDYPKINDLWKECVSPSRTFLVNCCFILSRRNPIMSKFSHLHTHTQFSLLDGAASIQSLYKKAIKDGMRALAIPDHGNMFGVSEFVAEAHKH